MVPTELQLMLCPPRKRGGTFHHSFALPVCNNFPKEQYAVAPELLRSSKQRQNS